MLRMKSDLLKTLIYAAEGRFSDMPPLEWDTRTALVVVMAAKGYPGNYPKNTPINGVAEANKIDGVNVFHAGE